MNLMFGLPETTGPRPRCRCCRRRRRRGRCPPGGAGVRQHFRHQRAADGGAHAPAVAVARRRSCVALLAVVAGMWWWGFDFGQIFGGFNRKEIEARLATLEADAAQLRAESRRAARDELAARKRARDDARRAGGAVASRRPSCTSENAQLKEELAFLQKLVADSNKQVGLSIQRLAVERERDDAWRYSMLRRARRQPEGRVRRAARAAGDRRSRRPPVAPRPPDHPDAARRPARARRRRSSSNSSIISGLRDVPRSRRAPGSRSLTVRAFEAGQASPAGDPDLVTSAEEAPCSERKKHTPPQKRIDSLIGAGTVVDGDVDVHRRPAHRRPGARAT